MTDTTTETIKALANELERHGRRWRVGDSLSEHRAQKRACDKLLALAAERDALKSTDNLNHPTRAWAAIEQIADAIGEIFGPVASVESADASLLRGPEYGHRADGIIEALQRVKAADRYAQGHAAALDDLTELLDNAVSNGGGIDAGNGRFVEGAHWDHEIRDQIIMLREGQKDG